MVGIRHYWYYTVNIKKFGQCSSVLLDIPTIVQITTGTFVQIELYIYKREPLQSHRLPEHDSMNLSPSHRPSGASNNTVETSEQDR